MLSRVAESIYWMSRQAERAENLARFIEVTLHMSLDPTESSVNPWEPLVQVTGDNEWFEAKYGQATCQNVVQFLAFDEEYHSSMLTCLRSSRQNAKSVREAMPTESFEKLNEFYHFVLDSRAPQLTDPTADFFEQIRYHALMWTGVLDSTMSHDIAWHFVNVGRLLERADKTSRILDVKYFNLLPRVEDVGTAIDDLQWSTLLLAISGFEAYRREHHLMDIEKIVAFFLFHRSFPRSIYSCIAGAEWSLRQIEKESGSDYTGHAQRSTNALRHRLKNTNVKEVIAGGMHQFIDRLQVELNEIGDALGQDYFYANQPA
ncbi:alpha-E domain-containing protein [Roseiconus nitratireducens]|uniref:Alpha-E domain-containing protein n=2 Tax=Roseiconus nitratireducens TaxID=2605748 RepID=A0A5M6DES0_9BACT|nr:alpha-E domain-containing protein [Roseiconus nitratireducens]